MTHPIIPQIIELAEPIAKRLNLEIVDVVFQSNKRPAVLRINIRNSAQETGLNDCEQMSRALEEILDQQVTIPEAYVLEISSPGVSKLLSSERDFISFRGFAVLVTTTDENHQQWRGTLQKRDSQKLYLNQKGRIVEIPVQIIESVELTN
jgi:ribosome maturation factor RimP